MAEFRILTEHVAALDLLTVDPKYQRRGAGRMLVQWGTEVADKLGVKVNLFPSPNKVMGALTLSQAVVESSEEARGLYESEGFRVVEHRSIGYPRKWAERKSQEFIWMIRSAKEMN